MSTFLFFCPNNFKSRLSQMYLYADFEVFKAKLLKTHLMEDVEHYEQFLFCHNVFKRRLLQMHQNMPVCGKG